MTNSGETPTSSNPLHDSPFHSIQPDVIESLLAREALVMELREAFLCGSDDSEARMTIERALYIASILVSRDRYAANELEPNILALLADERPCLLEIQIDQDTSFIRGTLRHARTLGDSARDVYEILIEKAPSFTVLETMGDRLLDIGLDPQTSAPCRERALELLMEVLERDAMAVDDLEALVVDTDKSDFGPRVKWWFAQRLPQVLRHCYAEHNISFLPMPSIDLLITTSADGESNDIVYAEFAAAAETTDPEEVLRVLENAGSYPVSQSFVAIFLALSALKHPRISSDRILSALERAQSDTRPHQQTMHVPHTIGEQAEAAVSWWWNRTSRQFESDEYGAPGYVCTLHGGKQYAGPRKRKKKSANGERDEAGSPPPSAKGARQAAVAGEFRWLRHFFVGDVCPDCGLSEAGDECRSEFHGARQA